MAVEFPAFATDWELVRPVSTKQQGRVWLARKPAPDGWRWGYFKYAGPEHRYYAGPMLANEWIAAQLLRRLGLPIAEVEPAVCGTREGIVSLVDPRASRARQWRELPLAVRRRHMRTFFRPARLYGMVVFDVWTTNIDRGTGKNLIAYRLPDRSRWRWYLIDHALALHGSYYKWDHYGPWPGASWLQPWRVYTVPRGLRLTRRRVWPWVRRVEALPPQYFTELVRAVPSSHLTDREAEFIERLLRTRQRQLADLIDRWLRRLGR